MLKTIFEALGGVIPLLLSLLALACFVVGAFAIHFVAGMATLGLALMVTEWRIDRDKSDR